SVFIVFFFFQAEDGIRDATVTGVQTCALPISNAFRSQLNALGTQTGKQYLLTAFTPADPVRINNGWEISGSPNVFNYLDFANVQIGRASCREKSVELGESGSRKEKNKE